MPRQCRTALALGGIGVDIGAAIALQRRDQVGADPLRREVIAQRHSRIGRPRAAVIAHDDTAHRLDAAADAGLAHARGDLAGDVVHGLQPRCAKAVDLLPRHRLRVARIQQRRARQHAALFGDRLRTTDHHVIEQRGIEVAPVAQRLQHLRRQLHRRDLVQRAVGTALAMRGAGVIVDEDLGHANLSGAD